jgi:hypothetical protein
VTGIVSTGADSADRIRMPRPAGPGVGKRAAPGVSGGSSIDAQPARPGRPLWQNQRAMNSELEVLFDVVGRLEHAGIGYMLTGSVAMSVYVEPRMTRDIDVVVELARADVGRIVGLFSPDYYVDDEAVRSAVATRSMFNLFHLTKLVKVNLILARDDEFHRQELARRERHPLGGRDVWVISKEDLNLSKLLWAAPTESAFQLRDVRKLIASGADEAYLHAWDAKLGVDALLRKCMDERYDS